MTAHAVKSVDPVVQHGKQPKADPIVQHGKQPAPAPVDGLDGPTEDTAEDD